MKLKRIFILMILALVIMSCNIISATDLDSNNLTVADMSISENNEVVDYIDYDEENSQKLVKEYSNDELISSSESTIYVGTNSTHDGKGTEDDPFATLDLACTNVNNDMQKDKVTVVINDGTYYLGSFLKFNTNNLNIEGRGQVIIKNLDSSSQQSFGSLCNFSMSNIIFNASSFNFVADYEHNYWFTPFVGSNGNIIFDNCTFADYNYYSDSWNFILPVGLDYSDYSILSLLGNDNLTFNYCHFLSSQIMCMGMINYPCNLRFNYCNLGSNFNGEYSFGIFDEGATLVLDSCWLGHNNGYSRNFYNMYAYNGDFNSEFQIKNNPYRHAVLEVSENYLGNNIYELVGKLLWNDGTNDNIDKLGNMTVYLSADNGYIPKKAILKNGIFKVNYTSESDYHEITVKLDDQIINLNNKINFNLNSPIITYGDNQNITLIFSDKIKGTVYVTICNKTYHKYCDDQDNIIVNIDEILTKGTWDVNVSVVIDKNEFVVVGHGSGNPYTVEEIDSLGFNNTKLTVLGFDSKINVDNKSNIVIVTLTDSKGNLIKGATVTYNTTSGVEGSNITDDEGKFTISGLTGEFIINVNYKGNGSYNPSNKSESFKFKLPAVKTTIAINSTEKGIVVITVVDNENKPIANLEVKYSINGANSTNTTGADGTISIPVTGEGEIKAYFEGNDDYLKSEDSYKYNFTETTPTSDTNSSTNGTSGNGTSTNSGKTNTNNNQQTNKVTKKATKITAKKATFKAKKKTKKYTIVLKAGKAAVKKVKVTLKVGKKTYKATTNSKGKATFKITKLNKKGKYNAVIKFKGNKNYKPTTKKVKITVKK